VSAWDEAGQFLLTAGGTAVALRWAGFRFWKEKQKPPKSVCGCEHAFAMHDLRSGACHAEIRRANGWTKDGISNHWEHVPCGCRHYTGPIPIELEFRPPPIMPRPDAVDTDAKEQPT